MQAGEGVRTAKNYFGCHSGHHSGVGRDLRQQGHPINHGPIFNNHTMGQRELTVTVDWPNSSARLLASLDGKWSLWAE